MGHDHSLTNVSHSLTVSDSQVYSNVEFDLWPVYSGEQFRALWPSCLISVFILFLVVKSWKISVP